MKEILETTYLEYEKSSFLIDLTRHENGKLYIEITQRIYTGQGGIQKIKINPAVLTDLMGALQTLQYKLPKISVGPSSYLTESDQIKIIKNYLKGVTIKNLALQYDKDPELIEQIIRNKGLPIVDNEPSKKVLSSKQKTI